MVQFYAVVHMITITQLPGIVMNSSTILQHCPRVRTTYKKRRDQFIFAAFCGDFFQNLHHKMSHQSKNYFCQTTKVFGNMQFSDIYQVTTGHFEPGSYRVIFYTFFSRYQNMQNFSDMTPVLFF